MVTFNYRGMQEELRKLNKDIGKIARTSAERNEEHRRNNSYCMHTPKETISRIQEKSRVQEIQSSRDRYNKPSEEEQLKIEVKKMAKASAERSEEFRRNNSYCMHTPIKTLARIKEKSRFR